MPGSLIDTRLLQQQVVIAGLLLQRLSAEMRRVGMTVCCSHTGYKTTMDVMNHADRPVIFSIRRIERAVPGSSRVRSRVR